MGSPLVLQGRTCVPRVTCPTLQQATWLEQELIQVLYESGHALIQGAAQGLTHMAAMGDTCLMHELSCPLQEAEACKSGGHQRGPERVVRLDITG